MRDGVRALEDCWMFDEDESYDDGEAGWDAKKIEEKDLFMDIGLEDSELRLP